MTKAEAYLQRLKNDADFWHRKVDDIPGDSIPVNHPAYRMSCTASSKYAAAKYMYKLLTEEATPESDAVVCDVCTDNGHCPEYAPGKVCVMDRRDEHEAG